MISLTAIYIISPEITLTKVDKVLRMKFSLYSGEITVCGGEM